MSDDIIDPKLVAHWFATVQRARAELNIYAAAYGPSRDTEKTISKLDALLAGAIPGEIDDWSEARILDLARRAGLFGFEDRHTKPLLRFARALLASPQAPASDALMAEPVEIPNPNGWMTVNVDGLPGVGETVLGGLWHTDAWLKPEFARRFIPGTDAEVEHEVEIERPHTPAATRRAIVRAAAEDGELQLTGDSHG